jgi:hypothetical protein
MLWCLPRQWRIGDAANCTTAPADRHHKSLPPHRDVIRLDVKTNFWFGPSPHGKPKFKVLVPRPLLSFLALSFDAIACALYEAGDKKDERFAKTQPN